MPTLLNAVLTNFENPPAESPALRRRLIVNADDFGQSPGINRGIIQAHRQGIVTSTSLMVRPRAAAAAAKLAAENPDLCIGLHIDLGEWTLRDGEWVPVYLICDLKDEAGLKREAWRQLETFRQLMGREPSHIDSHQHVHRRREPFTTILTELAAAAGAPLRHYTPGMRFCGAFWGHNDDCVTDLSLIAAARLRDLLQNLPEGLTEMSCHPSAEVDFDSTYQAERLMELEVLCNRSIRQAIRDQHIELVCFRDVKSSCLK